jgi:rhodanese-related sulfurtransferase
MSPTRPNAPVPRRNAAETDELISKKKAVLVDVRSPAEWIETGVATPAHLLTLDDLANGRKKWRPFLERNRQLEIILYCQSGGRSALAARLLAAEGFRVANLGGLQGWCAAGLPLRRPEPAECR